MRSSSNCNQSGSNNSDEYLAEVAAASLLWFISFSLRDASPVKDHYMTRIHVVADGSHERKWKGTLFVTCDTFDAAQWHLGGAYSNLKG